MANIKISSDFSFVPAGRFYTDGDFSGQKFRTEFLVPRLSSNEIVSVDIDDTAGLGSSFLEEAFGGLVREGLFTAAQLHSKLRIIANSPRAKTYEFAIWKYIDSARRA